MWTTFADTGAWYPASPVRSPDGEGEDSVVRLGDALDDREAEADACVVGAYAFGAPGSR